MVKIKIHACFSVTAICIPYFFWKRKVNGVKPYEDPEKWKKSHSLSRVVVPAAPILPDFCKS
jgi:hypothetical protein